MITTMIGDWNARERHVSRALPDGLKTIVLDPEQEEKKKSPTIFEEDPYIM